MTADEAKERMLAWAEGRLSHANFHREVGAYADPAARSACEVAIVQADAAEVAKWAAVYTALLNENEERTPS